MVIYGFSAVYISGVIEFWAMRWTSDSYKRGWQNNCWHQDTLGM